MKLLVTVYLCLLTGCVTTRSTTGAELSVQHCLKLCTDSRARAAPPACADPEPK